MASGGTPENMESYDAAAGTPVVDMLVKSGLAPSKSEARRLMQGGGVKLDGAQLKDPSAVFGEKGEYVLSKGKNRFVKIIVG